MANFDGSMITSTSLAPTTSTQPAATTGLVDYLGRPIQKQLLTQRLAGASLMSIRQAVREGVAGGLTPQRLAMLMREADENNPEALMELAEEIEERDLHYLSILGTRKRQISQLPVSVLAASRDPADEKLAEFVEHDLVDTDIISNYLFDMLDAVGKGFSVGEIIWELAPDKWRIQSIDYVDPRFIRFDLDTRRVPMLLDQFGQRIPLAPFKFVFCKLSAKSGIPVRGGIVRPAAWAYLFKSFAIKDWVQFAEVYGMPLRVGVFPPGATDDDKAELLRAVAAIAVDAAGIIPSTMEIKFIETASKATTAEFFLDLANFFDQQNSKAVLGQTTTTDAISGGHAVSNEHNDVRADIERADAIAVSSVINQQIVRPYIDLNLGPQQNYPTVRIGREDEQDAALMASVSAQLVPLGLRVKVDDIYRAVGLTTPQPGDEILHAPSAGAPPPDPTGILAPKLNFTAMQPGGIGAEMVLLALAAGQNAHSDAIARAAVEQLGDWKQVMQPAVDQILARAKAAKNFAEFRTALKALHPKLDMSGLGDKLARITFQSLAGGVLGDSLGPHDRAIAAAEDWKVGGARDLAIVMRDAWDGTSDGAKLLDDAGIGTKKPNVDLARRGFMFYDASSPNLRDSYKDPFGAVVNGELKAVSSAIGALARFVPRTDVPQSLIEEARAIVTHYQAILAKMHPVN